MHRQTPWLGLLCWLLALGCRADPAEALRLTEHRPSAFSIQLLDADTSSQGSAAEGVLTVKSQPVTQMLWWSRPKRSPREQAEHERKLLVAAGSDAETFAMDEELQESRQQGHLALNWSTAIDKTRFRSTLIDCGHHQLLLTTMGPGQELIAGLHVRSLKSLSCDPAARPGE